MLSSKCLDPFYLSSPFPLQRVEQKDGDEIKVEKKELCDRADLPAHSYSMPGYGDQDEKRNCGKFNSLYVCKEHVHERKVTRDSCYRSSCPICYTDWLERTSDRAAKEILNKTLALRATINYEKFQLSHWVISLTPEQVETINKECSIKKIRKECVEILRKADKSDSFGITLFYHPYASVKGSDGKPTGKWVLRPHFHAIGNLMIPFNTIPEIQAKTGIVIKHIRHVDINFKSIKAVLKYELSHVGISILKPNEHSLVYYGLLSYNKFHIYQSEIRHYTQCQVCGNYLFKIDHSALKVEVDQDGNEVITIHEIASISEDNTIQPYEKKGKKYINRESYQKKKWYIPFTQHRHYEKEYYYSAMVRNKFRYFESLLPKMKEQQKIQKRVDLLNECNANDM